MSSEGVIFDLDQLRAAIDAGRELHYRFFWGHRPRADGRVSDSCFSQWWSCRFEVAGQGYSSADQFMMAEKARLFGDHESRAHILKSDDPAEAKKVGRGVRDFDEGRWSEARFDLVTRGNLAKFGQDERLRAHLLSTRDDLLVEASPTDTIWGIGLAADHAQARNPAAWRGLNLLGFALVRTRAILRGELPPPDGPTA
jgi:ribA/ribD-fused uncharacterized protein